MLVKATAAFRYAHDGVNVRMVQKDEEFECRDDLAPGLSGDGLIDGAPHGLPLLSASRREAMIEQIIAHGRAEMAKASDEDILRMAAAAEEHRARAAAAPEPDPLAPQATVVMAGATDPVPGLHEGVCRVCSCMTTVNADGRCLACYDGAEAAKGKASASEIEGPAAPPAEAPTKAPAPPKAPAKKAKGKASA
jgi:hypothetical protein